RRGLLRATAMSALIVAAMGSLTFKAMQSEIRANRLSKQRQAALITAHRVELHEHEERLDAQRLLYLADMNVAHRDWETLNVGHTLELLDYHRPLPGEEDRR